MKYLILLLLLFSCRGENSVKYRINFPHLYPSGWMYLNSRTAIQPVHNGWIMKEAGKKTILFIKGPNLRWKTNYDKLSVKNNR